MTTALAFALFYRVLRTTTTSTAAVLSLLEPLVDAVLADIALGEALSGWSVVGGLLMIGAVANLYMATPVSNQ
jgi:drug/metabolite transporter, DME family